MAITTYAELKTALADWSARGDLTSYLDDFIDQTESFFRQPPTKRPSSPGIPGIRANITRATGTFSTSNAYISRPTDFLEGYRLRITGDNGGNMEYVNAEQLGLATRSGAGKPRFWTVSDVIEFDVVPDSAYPYELSYYPDFVDLDGTDTTNWVLTNHPNAYLSGCMYHLNIFIKNFEEANNWIKQYKSVVAGINEAYYRSRFSQGPVASKVDHSTP